jgi:CHASE2 domain-containing sensor protein/signal transduction histidine kinase
MPLNVFLLKAPTSGYSRLAIAEILAVVFWGLSALGAFKVTDGIVYDKFLRWRAAWCQEPARVLLLEIRGPAQARDEKLLLKVLEEMSRLGAKQVIFNFSPEPSASSFFQEAERADNVILAQRVVPDPWDSTKFKLSEAPPPAGAGHLKLGVVHSPPWVAGVCRAQHSHFPVGSRLYPALEVRAAMEIVKDLPEFADGKYLIDFRGGPGSLPNVALERVLSGDLIPELVKDRSVIVGVTSALPEPGVYTPTTCGLETMSLLEYQGHALNSLLLRSNPSEVASPLCLGLLLILAFFSALAYQRLGVETASWLTSMLTLFYAASSFLLLLYARLWLPLSGPVLCQGTLFLVTVRHRALQLSAAMHRLSSDASSQLRDKYWPVHIQSAGPSWPLVANMINQTLDLNKLIFLEADPKECQLREILALHCSLGEIVDRRRNYTRSPYLEVLKAKKPLKVSNYLKKSSSEEEQYLCPLSFSEELLGFWAFGIEGPKAAAVPQFDSLIRDYTTRISELLYHARKATQREASRNKLQKRLSREFGEETYNNLSSTLVLLQNRLTTLEVLLNRMNAGIIVYDIFGRMLQINETMLSTLKKEDLTPFEMTALDLILALSEYDISKARRILRRVVVENSAVSFPVTFRSKAKSRFLMHLKPLLEESDKESPGTPKKTVTRSILCELVDTTSTAFLFEMKSRLTERLGIQLRNDLAAIDLSASLLGGDRLLKPQRKGIAEIIQAKVQNTVETLSECQQYLALDADMDDLERFPVDARPALAMALDEVRPLAAKRGVAVQLMEPSFVSYVFGSSKKLQELFKSILLLLTQDASDNSTLLVRVSESEDIVAFDFSDMGFGIPNELLQEYVFGDHPMASEEFQKIQHSTKWVQAWGGLLEASSDVGIGMHFTIHLVKFI